MAFVLYPVLLMAFAVVVVMLFEAKGFLFINGIVRVRMGSGWVSRKTHQNFSKFKSFHRTRRRLSETLRYNFFSYKLKKKFPLLWILKISAVSILLPNLVKDVHIQLIESRNLEEVTQNNLQNPNSSGYIPQLNGFSLSFLQHLYLSNLCVTMESDPNYIPQGKIKEITVITDRMKETSIDLIVKRIFILK